MKKILLIALLAVAAVGCKKDKEEEVGPKVVSVAFSPSVSNKFTTVKVAVIVDIPIVGSVKELALKNSYSNETKDIAYNPETGTHVLFDTESDYPTGTGYINYYFLFKMKDGTSVKSDTFVAKP